MTRPSRAWPIVASILLLAACSSPAAPAAAPSTAPIASVAAPSASPDPLATAGFSGTYHVVRTITAEDGFAFLYKVGAVEKRTYMATPSCSSGPCDVSVVVTGSKSGKPSTVLFKLVGGAYHFDLVEPTAQFHCTKKGTDYHQLNETTATGLVPTETALIGGVQLVTKMAFTTHYEVNPTGKAKTAGCTSFSVDMKGTAERDPAA